MCQHQLICFSVSAILDCYMQLSPSGHDKNTPVVVVGNMNVHI